MHASKADQDSLIQIKTRKDFLVVQSKGQKWTSHGLMLQTAPRELEGGHARIGYTVTKRVHKSAVVRNRIKRRLRAVAAEVLPHGSQGNRDYILVGRAGTLSRDYKILCEDLRWCLRKMGLDAKP